MWNRIWRTRHQISRRLTKLYSTVYALSSGQGKCGVAVIRISGSHAKEAILKMTTQKLLPKPRQAILTSVVDPVKKNQIDKGLILWFPGPGSFTGEDVCELQVHGGRAVVAAVLSGLSKLSDHRPADPGEFTKRAFLAGKMDLTEVEGLADLIHAETEQQRKQALLQMEGSLGSLYSNWKQLLLKSVAEVEAYIDFSEEENIEDNILEAARKRLQDLSKKMDEHLKDSRRGERLHNGVKTVIIGRPNVGKSSLFNYLVKRPAAIVTSIAGTTRDVVEVNIDIDGYPLLLADTAGVRKDTLDKIEKEGIRRTRRWTQSADLVLMVHDVQKFKDVGSLDRFLKKELTQLEIDKESTEILHIINKIDLLQETQREHIKKLAKSSAVCISCISEDGTKKLLGNIGEKLAILCGQPSRESPSLTQERHRVHLTHCLQELNEGLTIFNEKDITLAAHRLRKSLRHLGGITGHVTTDEVLDVIFKDFCVGK